MTFFLFQLYILKTNCPSCWQKQYFTSFTKLSIDHCRIHLQFWYLFRYSILGYGSLFMIHPSFQSCNVNWKAIWFYTILIISLCILSCTVWNKKNKSIKIKSLIFIVLHCKSRAVQMNFQLYLAREDRSVKYDKD